ncbi:hypothetical protein D3C84_924900 [compost metagenome]
MNANAQGPVLRNKARLQALQLSEQAASTGQNLLAFGGQRHVTTAAQQQGHAVVTLQLLDFPAHRALGQAQPCRRLGEVAGVGHFDQGLQGMHRGRSKQFIHAKTA